MLMLKGVRLVIKSLLCLQFSMGVVRRVRLERRMFVGRRDFMELIPRLEGWEMGL